MKKVFYFIILSLLIGCSSTRLVNSWKNPDIQNFNPKKLVVVGMTQNLNGRTLFEQKLKDQLSLRGINTVKSLELFNSDFTHSKQSEEDIKEVVKMLTAKGIDAILVTAVKGIDTKTIEHKGYYDVDYKYQRFRNYYFIYQNIYYQPHYYDDYKVYHVESSLYTINTDSERTLVWTGYIDLIDPSMVHKTVNDYVNEVVKCLEKEQLIKKL